jgi:hypothetical protein
MKGTNHHINTSNSVQKEVTSQRLISLPLFRMQERHLSLRQDSPPLRP